MPDVSCKQCGKHFYAKSNWLKIGWGKYCSRNCVFESQKKGRLVNLVRLYGGIVYLLAQNMETGRVVKKVIEKAYLELKLIGYVRDAK